MNEKSNPMPMMYKTIPAVAELNKVPGFDPLKFLRHKVSRKTNEEMLTGRTTSNKTVIFAGDPSLIGQIVPVTITEAQTWVLKGTLAE